MKVLLLHPEDAIPANVASYRFDIVVDFARAPNATYERWSLKSGCPIVSFYSFAEEMEDLYATRHLIKTGIGVMVDRSGIDWWDVLSLAIIPELQNLMLIPKLAEYLGTGCELYASRPFSLATNLQEMLGGPLAILGNTSALRRYSRHYSNVLSHLSIAQLYQVAHDKFDREHNLRRRLATRPLCSNKPVCLLPSGYINVSRMAVSLADLLPEESFLLVCARKGSRLRSVPGNVQTASLDSYFVGSDKGESAALLREWDLLKQRLVSCSKTFQMANVAGVFRRMPSLLQWALALRNAWARVFELESITACVCADDSNPYSRIPLILAKQQAIPTVALHHGALDLQMALKTQHADCYLAKSVMERDYLTGLCRLPADAVVGPASFSSPPFTAAMKISSSEAALNRSWLVFFTEPYRIGSWRSEEVYRELLPNLIDLASTCGLKLVFKLHPFESTGSHIRMLRKFLPQQDVRRIGVIAGPATPLLWRNTQIALTVESTTALECTALGIPVFLCGWLRHYHGRYQEQYADFGFGHILESIEQIANIPQLLESGKLAVRSEREPSMAVDPQMLRELLTGNAAVKTVLRA
jgi:hypothetical protein